MLSTLLSVLIVGLVLLLFLAALLIFRAMMYGRIPNEEAAVEVIEVEGPLVAEHLATAIRVETISDLDHDKINLSALDHFHTILERQYPRLHATLKREKVSGYSLLYTWPGRALDLDPVALLGHMDVVPVDPSTLAAWTHPPFSGVVAEGMVWGRGTLDIKCTVITVMEAVESLIKAGYQPERTLYLGFGHDEEIGGLNGARCIVELLQQRGIQLAAVLDEGGAIMENIVPGMQLPVALLGVTEKGHASFELSVEGRAGHSSLPPRHTAIGVLARAIARLEERPMPENTKMVEMMFGELGAFLPFSLRLALANSWLLGGLIRKKMAASSTTNALIRTSMAATMIRGGVKDNILPAQARAVINCRIFPGETAETVRDHIRKAVNDEAVLISLPEDGTWEPSPVSPVKSPVYQSLARTVRQVFPEAVVAPYLMTGASDSRYYTAICSNVYRFSPYHMDSDLLKTIHGTDERIPVEGLERMVQFYAQLVKTWTTVVGEAN